MEKFSFDTWFQKPGSFSPPDLKTKPSAESGLNPGPIVQSHMCMLNCNRSEPVNQSDNSPELNKSITQFYSQVIPTALLSRTLALPEDKAIGLGGSDGEHNALTDLSTTVWQQRTFKLHIAVTRNLEGVADGDLCGTVKWRTLSLIVSHTAKWRTLLFKDQPISEMKSMILNGQLNSKVKNSYLF